MKRGDKMLRNKIMIMCRDAQYQCRRCASKFDIEPSRCPNCGCDEFEEY